MGCNCGGKKMIDPRPRQVAPLQPSYGVKIGSVFGAKVTNPNPPPDQPVQPAIKRSTI